LKLQTLYSQFKSECSCVIIFSILFLILSNAVTLRRDKSILYSRVVIIVLLYSSLLAINTLFITSLGTGIALYGGPTFLVSTSDLVLIVDIHFFIIYIISLDLNYISISLALIGIFTVITLLLIFLHPIFKHNYPMLYRYIWIISVSLLIVIILYFLIEYYWNGFVFTGRGNGGPSGTPSGTPEGAGPTNPAPGGPNRMAIGNMLQGDNGDTVFSHDGQDTSVNCVLDKLRAQYMFNRDNVGRTVSWKGFPNNNTLNTADIALVKSKIATDTNPLKVWVVMPSYSTRNPVDQIKVITEAGRSSHRFITYFLRLTWVIILLIFLSQDWLSMANILAFIYIYFKVP
jgi:hypothetical protein